MRPVERGLNKKAFKRYQEARGDLIARLGQYCSYCEMKLPSSLHVEHVQPKSHSPALCCQWDNLLLACVNCNSSKGDKEIQVKNCLWPDRDNTFLAFIYNEGGIISVNPGLSKEQRKCAQNILNIIGLQKHPGNNIERTDRRWNNRKEVWDMAYFALKRLNKMDTEEMREQIVETAYHSGFWSTWMTVFKKEGRPVPRKGGTV
jgi:uncharacterized protein (TIGR02646 family)